MSGIVNPTPASTGANPTASVGLTAVNGSAATFMRSDAAPPLDQTAAFAFSGLGATTISQQGASASALTLIGGTVTTSQPLINAIQTWNAGGTTFTGLKLNVTSTASAAASLLLDLQVGGTSQFKVDKVGNVTIPATGYLIAGRDGTRIPSFNGEVLADYFNVNQSGASVSIAIGYRNASAIALASTGALEWGNSADAITGTLQTFVTSPAAATLQLGAANAASPVAQTVQAQGSRAGTDASTAGGGLTIQPGIGTGNVGTSTLTLNGIIGNVTSTTTAQTTAAGISVPGVASGQLPGAVIGSAAIATNATDGFLYIASGAGPPTGTPTAFTGRVPFYYDSTNDQLYIYRGGWKQPKTPAGAAVVNWQ